MCFWCLMRGRWGRHRPPPGVTALSMRVEAGMGEQHGVFRVGKQESRTKKQEGGAFPRVVGTMQKASVEQMRSAGVTDARGRVLIDSGLVFFDSGATNALHGLSRKYDPAWHLKTRQQIDLYADIVPAALGKFAQPVLTGDRAIRKLQEDLRGALKDSPLHVYELEEAHFQHLGTTRQFRDAMTGADPAPACRLFQQNVRAASESVLPGTGRVYQTVITTDRVKMERGVVLENCLIEGAVRIGAGSVLSNLAIGGNGRELAVPAETLIYGVPIAGSEGEKGATVTVVMGVHDDPKTDRTFCNIDLRHWLTLAGVSADDVWDVGEGKRVLWTARLFTTAGVAGAMWMVRPETLGAAERAAWKKARRYSMAEILELADAAAMASHRDGLSGMLQAMEWIEAVEGKRASSVQNAVNHFGAAGYQRLVERLFAEGKSAGVAPLVRARLNWTLGEIESRPHFPRESVKMPAGAGVLQRKAFENIREAMTLEEERAREARVVAREGLVASAPVRLDLAGGWTDTPPYCLENGGTVVNVAVDLNDVEPIQAVFRPLEEPIVRLVSRDLGKTLVVKEPGRLMGELQPGDPFALHVAAMRLTGVGPGEKEGSQKKWLGRVMRGGKKARGFELSTASNLPKGSGMGTSSILGAATLAVLRKAVGLENSAGTLFEQTLLLEQSLGTGGGWQDQVGGIVGGVKMTETRAGIPQVLRVRKIALTAGQLKGLEERLVVYFTGQQRLARNILREVMGRYLSREPGTMVLFNELAHAARACEAALKKSDWMSVATEVNRYWRIKKDLFAGSTTPAVDALFLELRPYYLGGGLAGAGGGGFAYFLCGDADQAHRLRTELARISMRPGSLGLTFAATINAQGLRVGRA
ncbi:MAG: fucose pyrophosphorylase domain-containing protein [Phycisphaerae bacterium]